MIYAAIGATGWTLPQIMGLTFAQFDYILAGQGQILYPRLKPELDAAFANLSSTKRDGETESDIQRVLREDREAREAHEQGRTIFLTAEQEERQAAYRAVNRQYLPPETVKPAERVAPPLPGMRPDTARAIVAHAEEGGITGLTWARDVAPIWLEIKATAALP